ncbi:coiled-coil domain-containing protein 180 [Nematolebias whitei]|uniref:coiled-coil domain-containing protein 180 n=1 Tax=Nematolebias whitei TaxID=451745 RepID=UPI00189772D1|nr:coiled-coil domain-containing protein 180 [Nematolebias whitei]
MSQSREVPDGKAHRQVFEAQAQLSLLAGCRDRGTVSVSSEDSDGPSNTSSRRQLVSRGGDDVIADVTCLPVSVVNKHSRSDIIDQMKKRKSQKHNKTLEQLQTHLTHLAQMCETDVRTACEQLLSSLRDANLRLDTLRDRMRHLEHISLQEVHGLWGEVEKEIRMKRTSFSELDVKLRDVEKRRSDKIRVLLRKHCGLLEQISFLPPPHVHRLIHAEATKLNQSLLVNRCSSARLLLCLQEQNLQQESSLHQEWENGLDLWRSSRIHETVDQFRAVCSRDEVQQLISDQQNQTQQDLIEQRCDIISKICLLVPPTCSPALVSDWFDELTAVNQQTDRLHSDLLHQLRCLNEQTRQNHLAAVERCKEALSVHQVSDKQVDDIINSQILPLIGRQQSQDDERLAALEVCSSSVACHAVSISRYVFDVMRAAALLWETHRCRLKRREEELQQHLNDIRQSQQQRIQKRTARVDVLLGRLRQESSKDALNMSLEKTVQSLEDIEDSCRQCVTDQWEVLDRLPALLMEELVSYSRSICSFFKLSPAYHLSVQPSSTRTTELDLETSGETETLKPDQTAEKNRVSCQNQRGSTQNSHKHLSEAESSLLRLCDISTIITFTSTGGTVYTGPAFKCPAPDLSSSLQQEAHLSLFPADLLTHTLSRTRTLILDHLEQNFQDLLSSSVTMVTSRKEAVRLEQELQLQQLKPEYIRTHIYEPRLAELQLHQQRVDVHCQEMLDVLSSCRTEQQQLQISTSSQNQNLLLTLSNMEEEVQEANSVRRLEALGSALQDCLDRHVKETQRCRARFRHSVQSRLKEGGRRTAELLGSFRMFSEGGDFTPHEVKMFQKRLKEETKRVSGTVESIYAELELFESRSLQQVREASARVEGKLSALKAEMEFTEKIEKIIRSAQIQIKTEAASSNQQQSVISSRLEDIKRTMGNKQVSPDEVCCLLSSAHEDISKRCQYLDFSLNSAVQDSAVLTAHPKSRRQVRVSTQTGSLQLSRTGVDLHEDPVVGVVRFSLVQDSGADHVQRRRRASAGQSLVQRQQRSTESVSSPSSRKGCRPVRTDIRAERKFQIFGSKQEAELNPHSFSSAVQSILWRANNSVLQHVEDFYRNKLSSFFLLPDSLDQWAEGTQKRLLGYQEQARRFLSESKQEVVKQLSVFRELLSSLPPILISNHEQQQGAWLREEVGGGRKKLEELMAISDKEKSLNIRQLRFSLRDDELQALNSREELRQQQLHSSVIRTHMELQECVHIRAEQFVTSLASLSEKLLHQLDELMSPAETRTTGKHQPTEYSSVTMETGSETGSELSSLKHEEVIKLRDAAVKRFQQLLRSETSRLDEDKQRHLSEEQSWNSHWRQQIHTLTHIRLTHTPDCR